jgi:hypothetical protein
VKVKKPQAPGDRNSAVPKHFGYACILAFVVFSLFSPSRGWAQGAPPFNTNDPGTPGAEQWEINIGILPVVREDEQNYQMPQIDFNYGVGSRVQLTFEVPYVLQTAPGHGLVEGWDNGFAAVKWRFIDNKHGWNISTFPQMEINGLSSSVRNGIANRGPRFLLPFEVQRNVGPMDLDFEAGYYFPIHGRPERIIGSTAGHDLNKKLEIGGEVYNDYAVGAQPGDTTWDLGFHYQFHKGLLLLFMAGRSFSRPASGQPNFLSYTGIQILLDHNGRHLHADDE